MFLLACKVSMFFELSSHHEASVNIQLLLSDRLPDCCLVNLIDVTLACENAKSKLVKVVTVADVNDEDRVRNSLLQIWKLRFA